MSTNGSIGICIKGNTHWIYNHFDSYPSGLGQRLVSQIKVADIAWWREAASELCPTVHWYGPDFTLAEDEISHITTWIKEKVDVTTSIETDKGASWLRVCEPQEGEGLFESGEELALAIEPTLRHDAAAFFNAIAGKLNAILALGLFPKLSPRFVESAWCEWVYLVDLDNSLFRVCSNVNDEKKWLDNERTGIWSEPVDYTVELHEYASFPLDAIPDDWEEQVEDSRDEL